MHFGTLFECFHGYEIPGHCHGYEVYGQKKNTFLSYLRLKLHKMLNTRAKKCQFSNV